MKNSIFQAPEPFTKEFDRMLIEAPNMYAVLVAQYATGRGQ